MKNNVAKKHNKCLVSIRWKMFGGQTTPTPGLFCQTHNVFLDWLTIEMAHDLINNHNVPVENWMPKTKPK